LKTRVILPRFDNVDIYPLIARLLRLNLPQQLDGNVGTLLGILK